jgi:16S rRNA (guanine(966)-N(2))-methyltransferase RsmD
MPFGDVKKNLCAAAENLVFFSSIAGKQPDKSGVEDRGDFTTTPTPHFRRWSNHPLSSIITPKPILRIIAGKLRGRRLRAPEGLAVRPTSDRLRETLFNILSPKIEGSRFLDLCAGSGAIGIEAVSRGAAGVVFVDNSRRACRVIEDNLRILGINQSEIIASDALRAMIRLEERDERFDIIFFDPPYDSDIYSRVLARLASSPLLAPDAVVIVERRSKDEPVRDYGGLKIFRQVKQGDSALAFYETGRQD